MCLDFRLPYSLCGLVLNFFPRSVWLECWGLRSRNLYRVQWDSKAQVHISGRVLVRSTRAVELWSVPLTFTSVVAFLIFGIFNCLTQFLSCSCASFFMRECSSMFHAQHQKTWRLITTNKMIQRSADLIFILVMLLHSLIFCNSLFSNHHSSRKSFFCKFKWEFKSSTCRPSSFLLWFWIISNQVLR